MPFEVCFAYPWATLGGVERVFLNRAQAFLAEGEDVRMHVHYAADGGGLAAFEAAIASMGLRSRIDIVREFDPSRYDAVCVIDAPDLLPARDALSKTRWIVECHTPYPHNRAYLEDLPDDAMEILVPSPTFATMLARERPALAARIRVLRNCVMPGVVDHVPTTPRWARRPLLFFGRMDELKNPQALIDLLAALDRRRPGAFFVIAAGPEVPGYDFDGRVAALNLRDCVLRLPPIAFLRTHAFLAAMRQAGAIMVSPSRGESFGLAAAESMAAGLPVLLSRLPEHAALVGNDHAHLFDPDDAEDAAARIEALSDAYDARSSAMLRLATQWGAPAFVADWRAIFASPAAARARAG